MSANPDDRNRQQDQTLAEQFERVLGGASDVISLFDVAADRTYLNSVGRRTLFPRDHKGEDEDPFAHVHADDRKRVRATYAEIVRTGQSIRHRYRVVDAEGKVQVLEADSSPIRDPSSRVIAVLCITRDVTGERRLDAALRLTIRSLFEQPTVAIGITDVDGHFLSINDAGKHLLGCPEGEDLSKRSVFDVVHPADRPRVDALRSDLLAGRIDRFTLEKRIVRGDGEMRWVICNMALVRPPLEGRSFIIVMGDDITERKRVEEELRQREELLRTIFEHAPIGLALFAPDGRLVRANPRFQQMLGYAEDELRGKIGWELLHPDDVAATRAVRDELFAGERKEFSLERRFIRKSGEVLWTRNAVALTHEADGKPQEAVALIEDISERKLAEAAIHATAEKLQALTRRLVEMQEDERRDIARELHDRVGQALAAMRINMDMIRRRLDERDDALIRARNDDSFELLESTFRAVENVMYDLRPPMLDEYGVIASLQWYAKKFTDRTGIEVEIRAQEGWRGGADTEVALYRIAQEALTNVARHAKAQRVTIDFQEEGPDVVLTIEDDGMGFDQRQQRLQVGYGLTTMRERAESVGGMFEARSDEGGGTRITVMVPRK